MSQSLPGFPIVVTVPVAWGEMDSFGHVNNIVFFRYFENARIAYFDRAGISEHMRRMRVGPILAEARCRFRKPLRYPDTLEVGTRARDIGEDRFRMDFAIWSRAHGALAAEGDGLIVYLDYATQSKARIPDPIREAMRALGDGA